MLKNKRLESQIIAMSLVAKTPSKTKGSKHDNVCEIDVRACRDLLDTVLYHNAIRYLRLSY
jgi:hypothetical protein